MSFALEGSDTRGLVDAIADDRLTLPDVVQHLPRFNLSVLPAGRSPASPYEALHSPRLEGLLEEGRLHYAYVVVDTRSSPRPTAGSSRGSWIGSSS